MSTLLYLASVFSVCDVKILYVLSSVLFFECTTFYLPSQLLSNILVVYRCGLYD